MTARNHETSSASSATSVSEAVVTEVVAAIDRPPERVQPPLATVIDPDALDGLFRGATADGEFDGRVSFAWAGCRVDVSAADEVDVRPIPDGAPDENATSTVGSTRR